MTAPVAPSILRDFTPFSAFHVMTAGALIVLMAASAYVGTRWRGTAREARLRRAWIASIALFQAVVIAWFLSPRHFDIQESLPLQVCDLVPWIACLALWARGRAWRALLYFWGIGLSTQAFFTPIVEEGLGHPKFWFFWLGHTQIVGSAIYDVVVLRYRPTAKDLGIASAALTAYALAMIGLDVALGVNYVYVGNMTPPRPTIIDRLGPWPMRVVWLGLIAHGVMAASWAAWPLGRFLTRRPREAGVPPRVDSRR